ncbi:hypothetical protein [Clostridium luticellarii]|nr:hypothetical protein [Clostridium luticellarii]
MDLNSFYSRSVTVYERFCKIKMDGDSSWTIKIESSFHTDSF